MLALRGIRCRNFKCFDELDLSFPEKGTVLVEGANDAGKSSLVDAVRFGLTGLTPSTLATEDLVRHGEREAAVTIELAGASGGCVIERSVSNDGTVQARLVVDVSSEISVLDDEARISVELTRLTGLDVHELSRTFFIEASRSPDLEAPPEELSASGLAIPKRRELDSVRADLGDVAELDEALARARNRVSLAEAADRLVGLEKILSRAERLLKIARVRRAQLDFQAAKSELELLNDSLSDWEQARSDINSRIDMAERRSAVGSLADAILRAWDRCDELERRIDETSQHVEQATRTWSEMVHEKNKIAKVDRALEQLAEPRVADRRVKAATDAKVQAEAVLDELEALDLERTILEENREIAWAREAATDRSNAEHDPNLSDGAVVLWKAWVAAAHVDGPWRSRGIRRWRDAVAALAANGMQVPGSPDIAGKLIARARTELRAGEARSRAGANGDPDLGSGSNGKAKSVYWRITEIDERIGQLRGPAEDLDMDALESELSAATVERDTAREGAANVLAGLHVEVELEILKQERELSASRLSGLEDRFDEKPTFEIERDQLIEQFQRAREEAGRLVARLRKLQGDSNAAENIDRPVLTQIRDDMASRAATENTAVLEREVSQVTGKIAGLEPALEETRYTTGSNFEILRRRAAEAGVILDAEDADVSLESALPQLSKLTGSESAVLESEVDRLTTAIPSTKDHIERLESKLECHRSQVDLPASRAEIESLEREIKTRRRAAAIADRASIELTRRSVSQATRIARTLVLAFTGNTYFDVRVTDTGEFEIWDEDASRWVHAASTSAGLRSQVYLALRLAAAVTCNRFSSSAGTAFLFVDDPIVGADPSRRDQIAAAILDDLVRDSFPQIVIMAVEGCLDARMFDYSIGLEDGKVAASTLPDREPAESGAAARNA